MARIATDSFLGRGKIFFKKIVRVRLTRARENDIIHIMKFVVQCILLLMAFCGGTLYNARYGFKEGRKMAKHQCVNPRRAWICGEVVCKSDGVKSPNLVFSFKVARAYFQARAREMLLRVECGHRVAVADMMKDAEIEMPCGKCLACQANKRKDMSVRLAHEASQFEDSCFITLTYDDDHVPSTDNMRMDEDFFVHESKCVGDMPVSAKHFSFGSEKRLDNLTLFPKDVQDFMKRLRRHLEYLPKKEALRVGRDHVTTPIRYFAVGEYGSKTHRPHYHIIIFGWCPSDAQLLKLHNKKPVYISGQLQKLWKFGFSSFSTVSPFVAKYCARYVTKKFVRKEWKGSNCVIPEFTFQSVRNGGIGATWFDKFGEDACVRGICTLRAGDRIENHSIPQYYWNRLRKRNLPLWLSCRDSRIDFINKHGKKHIDVDAAIRACQVQEQEILYFANRETF